MCDDLFSVVGAAAMFGFSLFSRASDSRAAIGLTALVMFFTCAQAPAQDDAQTTSEPQTASQATPTAEQQSEPKGILPVPDYSGDFWQRSYLTGDWGGTRSDLADRGVQFNVTFTQYVQSIVDGGRSEDTAYGGRLQYTADLDLMRMGLLEGALVSFRAETRYGESVNGQTLMLQPVNTYALFPLTNTLDENIGITVTELNYTQFLSEKFAVLVGKLMMFDNPPNEFASGQGDTQFMNSNFIYNPVLSLRFPYSTLGTGVLWLPNENVTVTSLVFLTADSSTTTGFDDFDDGGSWLTQISFQYRLGHLPGGQYAGVLYAFDQDFTKIDGRLIFVPGQGFSIPTEDDTWAVYWSAWQYLFVEGDAPDRPLNLNDGQPDLQGVGLFVAAGFADQDTNPIEWTISGGVGGRGIIPTRDNDTFGIGYFYIGLQPNRLTSTAAIDDEVQGFEAYYNIAITPAAQLTFDIQTVDSAVNSVDTAVILGARLYLRF